MPTRRVVAFIHDVQKSFELIPCINGRAHPACCAQWKVAPALAAGNTAVLKPSEVCSVTCLEMAAIAHEVGLPAGVLNVICGYGADAGAPLRCSRTRSREALHPRALHCCIEPRLSTAVC